MSKERKKKKSLVGYIDKDDFTKEFFYKFDDFRKQTTKTILIVDRPDTVSNVKVRITIEELN